MKPEPATLARLVIEYFYKFGCHVPEAALRRPDALLILQEALAAGTPLPEAMPLPEERVSHMFRPGGCVIILEDEEDRNPGVPRKRSDGEWLH